MSLNFVHTSTSIQFTSTPSKLTSTQSNPTVHSTLRRCFPLTCCTNPPSIPLTTRLTTTPMPQSTREYYSSHFTNSVTSAILNISEFPSNLISTSYLLPELNPSLDIYDRRVLLTFLWNLIMNLTHDPHSKTIRILTQSPTQFGGLPLSVAGLHKTLQADIRVSQSTWSDELKNRIRLGFLGDFDSKNSIADDDDVFIIVCATNSTSSPVINQIMETIEKEIGRERPVVLVNPRLGEVPSHSGVMQVKGRGQRMEFVETINCICCCELLYRAGSLYPLLGVLWRQYPGNWELYARHEVVENEKKVEKLEEKLIDEEYVLVWEGENRPDRDVISECLKMERKRNQKLKAVVDYDSKRDGEVVVKLMLGASLVTAAVALGLPVLGNLKFG